METNTYIATEQRTFSIRKKIDKYSSIFRITVMDALVYISDFIGTAGFFAFITGVYLILWKTIYSQGSSRIDGFNLNMMIWYLIITEMITLSTSNYYQQVSEEIITGNVATVARLAFEFIITLSIYPATIYRSVIKVNVYSLLPAAFISFVPARLSSDFDLKWMGLLFIMTAIWVFVAFSTFNFGLRKYESGNLNVQKL